MQVSEVQVNGEYEGAVVSTPAAALHPAVL